MAVYHHGKSSRIHSSVFSLTSQAVYVQTISDNPEHSITKKDQYLFIRAGYKSQYILIFIHEGIIAFINIELIL
jgi:hypothetical protein